MGSNDDANDHLGGSRQSVLLASAVITLAYAIISSVVHLCLCTFRLRHHQMKHVVHRRERIGTLVFLFMLLVTQATTVNLSAYISNRSIARHVSETALFAWIMVCGLALMTSLVAILSKTYARIHLYLGVVLSTSGVLVLLADAAASGKVAALDSLLGASCMVGLWTTFYAVPIAFHLTVMMTGPSDLNKAEYRVALDLGHATRAPLLPSTESGIILSRDVRNETVYAQGDDRTATELDSVVLSNGEEEEEEGAVQVHDDDD